MPTKKPSDKGESQRRPPDDHEAHTAEVAFDEIMDAILGANPEAVGEHRKGVVKNEGNNSLGTLPVPEGRAGMNEQSDHEGEQPAYSPPPAASKNAPAAAEQQKLQPDIIQNLERRVSSTERGMLRWTRAVALFTFVSAIATCIYVYSFIESERAYLLITNAGFTSGEPTVNPGGLDVFLEVKNIGKHTGTIAQIYADPAVSIHKKELPDIPDYSRGHVEWESGASPIAPDAEINVFGAAHEPANGWDLPLPNIISGITNGNIPMRIYGFIKYDIGYPFLWKGKTGFCFQYVPPPKRRIGGSNFSTCKNSAYTYTQ